MTRWMIFRLLQAFGGPGGSPPAEDTGLRTCIQATRGFNADGEWIGLPASAAGRQSEAVELGSGDHTAGLAADAMFVGESGSLVCRLVGDDSDRTFASLVGGVVYPFAVSVVRESGTTCTGMILLRET